MEFPAKDQGSLSVAGDLNEAAYEIFAIPEAQLEGLLSSGESVFKDGSLGGTGGEGRSGTLHTASKTYDIVKLDCSNTLLLAEAIGTDLHGPTQQSYVVHKIDKYVIELTPSLPNKCQVVSLLRNKATYKDEDTDYATTIDSERTHGLTFVELLDACQISKGELQDVLQEVHAFPIGDRLFVFDLRDLLYRTKTLILDLHQVPGGWAGLGFSEARRLLPKLPESAVKALLDTAFDPQAQTTATNGEGTWSVSGTKLERICGLLLLVEKRSFTMAEFLAALSKLETLLMPEATVQSLREAERKDGGWAASNLFPGFTGANLAFLHKQACIIPASATAGKKETTIEFIDYFKLSGNLRKRLCQLCEIKKEWTKLELQTLLLDFLPPGQTLDNVLAKQTKWLTIPHPFAKGTIIVYSLK
jgi:hypothetical protein